MRSKTGLAAAGDIALNQGLDAGLTINDAKQLYAYAGFPRGLNSPAS